MRIRKFRIEDAVEVARLHRNTIRRINGKDYSPQEIGVWSGRTSAKRMRSSLDKINRYIATENEKIVGFGDFDIKGELGGLYIHKDHIREGIGRKLLERLEEEAHKKGLTELHLDSTETAKNFYIRHGYKLIKKSKHKIANQQITIYKMRKKLNK